MKWIGVMSGESSKKKLENHLDYLIRSKKLKDLKNNGRTVKAQATTTKRTQVNTEQQLQWHSLITFMTQEGERLNLPSKEWQKYKQHFWWNLDETGVQISEGNLRVLGAAEKKKHENNVQDARKSITIVRSGSAAGTRMGPWMFLAEGQKMEHRSMRNLPKNHGAPPGSRVFMAPTAYMTDEVWKEMVPYLCKELRDKPVVRDHPDWWLFMTLDGYSSHLVGDVLEIFNEHKIFIIKEEGDTSQVCQPCDQHVAKSDKLQVRSLLDVVRHRVKRMLTQWDLIVVCCHALAGVKGKSWTDSFKKVNLHPDFRKCFTDWKKQIEVVLKGGDPFFKKRTGLFDAMPACWKNESPDFR